MNTSSRAIGRLSATVVASLALLMITVIIKGDGVVSPEATTIIFFLAGSIAIAVLPNQVGVRLFAIAIYWVKLSVIFFLYSSSNVMIFPDSITYVSQLDALIASGKYDFSSVTQMTGTLHVGFHYLLVPIYKLFGNTASIMFFNALLVSIASVLLHSLVRTRFSSRAAVGTFILFSISTNMFLFGSFILRDGLIVFLTILSLYIRICYNKMALPILISLLLVSVRIYSGIGLFVALLVDFLLHREMGGKKRIWLISLSLISAFILTLSPVSQTYLGAGTRFLTGVAPLQILAILPVTLAKFFFSPLPWNVTNSENVYQSLAFDSIAISLLSFGLVLFIVKFLQSKQLRLKSYLFLVPIMVHALALGIEYDGDSDRQRSGIFAFLIMFLFVGIFHRIDNIKARSVDVNEGSIARPHGF